MTAFPRYGADVRSTFLGEQGFSSAVAWADQAVEWRKELGTLMQNMMNALNADPGSLALSKEVRDAAWALHGAFTEKDGER